MRNKYEIGCDNASHIRDACEVSETLLDARKLLREAGFAFRAERLRAVWDSVHSDPDRAPLAFDY